MERVLDGVRPFIHSHEGEVAVVKLDGAALTLKVSGRCANCALADLTYNSMLRDLINQAVPEIKTIIFEHDQG